MTNPDEPRRQTAAVLAVPVVAVAFGVYLAILSPVISIAWFVLGAAAVAGSLKYGARIRHVTACLLVMAVCAFAASNLGERDQREVATIADLKGIQSGELAYAAAYGGTFDTLECLVSASCVSGDRPLPFLDTQVLTTERRGYRFEFFEGPPSLPIQGPRSRSTMTRFAVVAIPVQNHRTPGRAFCADDTGGVYVLAAVRAWKAIKAMDAPKTCEAWARRRRNGRPPENVDG